MKKIPLYHAWITMRQRAKHANVHVDPQWASFEQFEKDMGPKPPGMDLVRGVKTRGFGPDNCYWKARGRGSIEFSGTSLPAEEWARRIGISSQLIKKRLSMGWSVEDALLKKVRSWGLRPDDRLYAIRCSGPTFSGYKLTPWSEDLAEVYALWKARVPGARAERFVMEIVRQSRTGVIVVLR